MLQGPLETAGAHEAHAEQIPIYATWKDELSTSRWSMQGNYSI